MTLAIIFSLFFYLPSKGIARVSEKQTFRNPLSVAFHYWSEQTCIQAIQNAVVWVAALNECLLLSLCASGLQGLNSLQTPSEFHFIHGRRSRFQSNNHIITDTLLLVLMIGPAGDNRVRKHQCGPAIGLGITRDFTIWCCHNTYIPIQYVLQFSRFSWYLLWFYCDSMFQTYCSLYVCCRGTRESHEKTRLDQSWKKKCRKQIASLLKQMMENKLWRKNTVVFVQVKPFSGIIILRYCQTIRYINNISWYAVV